VVCKLSRKFVRNELEDDDLLELYHGLYASGRPFDHVLRALITPDFYQKSGRLNVSHLGVGALLRLLAELPPDAVCDQDPVTIRIETSFKPGVAVQDFYSDVIKVGADANGQKVWVYLHLTKRYNNFGFTPIFNCFPAFASMTCELENKVDTNASKPFSSCDTSMFHGKQNFRGFGFESAFDTELSNLESEYIVPHPTYRGVRYCTSKFTFQLKASTTKRILLERWAWANGLTGYTLTDLLVFCDRNFHTTFNSLLLPHAAFHFQRVCVDPTFCSLSLDFTEKLLAQDDVKRVDDETLLLSMGPWIASHTAHDVVSVLKHVNFCKIPVLTVKASFAPGGILHALRKHRPLMLQIRKNFDHMFQERSNAYVDFITELLTGKEASSYFLPGYFEDDHAYLRYDPNQDDAYYPSDIEVMVELAKRRVAKRRVEIRRQEAKERRKAMKVQGESRLKRRFPRVGIINVNRT
jgi:hypothetical protein